MASKQFFKIADKNANGVLDKQELKDALLNLGFTHLSDKAVGTHAPMDDVHPWLCP